MHVSMYTGYAMKSYDLFSVLNICYRTLMLLKNNLLLNYVRGKKSHVTV